ncbi:MAG: type IVB secretion system protein IcmH/DotU [Kiloniellales bacterium]|nr:type IVB secretion system protein IcmH/DotU [Kiloniellales bacterium]
MPERDPFADFNSEPEDLERTIIVPAPGGRRRPTGESPAPAPPPPRAAPPPPPPAGAVPNIVGSGKNPLIKAAGAAFALVRRLRETPQHPDPEGLRNSVIGLVKSFESQAREFGANAEAAYAARYALAALIDESVLSMPWGSQSSWSHESVLVTLHNEARGGAKFFQIVDRMMENPAANIDLLEFLHLCLCLGFQGKYAVVEDGQQELEAITQNLYRAIRNQRGEIERDLSPRWQGLTDRRPAVARIVPMWVVPVTALGIAVLMFLGFSYAINRSSDDVFASMNKLGREGGPLVQLPQPVSEPVRVERVTVAEQAPTERPAERLQALLQPEIDRGLVEVSDLGNATKILVHNLNLFRSGSAQVTDNYKPVLTRIAEVLKNEPTPVLVTGHTDSDPVRGLKFQSNWHLSVARAKSVATFLAASLGTKNLKIEGRGADDPIANNETVEGRRINRRVEIRVPVQ